MCQQVPLALFPQFLRGVGQALASGAASYLVSWSPLVTAAAL